MNKRPPVALQPLHDEAFTAEKADAKSLLKRNPDADAFCCRQKASFCVMSSPPTSDSLIGTMRPGYGAANDTRFFPWPLFKKTVMNNDSPTSSRFPAPSNASTKVVRCCEPSPNTSPC